MKIGFIGKEYEIIKSWKVDHNHQYEEICVKQPLGTLMVEFYSGTTDRSFFEFLIHKYGMGLFEYRFNILSVTESSSSFNQIVSKAYHQCYNDFSNAMARYRSAVTNCVEIGEIQEIAGKSLKERLYLYSKKHGHDNDIFAYCGEFQISFDMQEHENDNVLIEFYQHYNISYILFIELKEMVLRNVSIKRCRNCNRYFPVNTRTDTEFCPNTPDGETKPCNTVGATRKYHENFRKDPLNVIYKRGYAVRHSKVLKGVMSNESLRLWMKDAKEKIKEVKEGTLSVNEFEEWSKLNH